MKTYKSLIVEISEFRKQFRENDVRYPGVYMFMTVATRYLNRPEKLKDSKLVRLLKKLRLRSDISDFRKTDFMRVFKFMKANNLNEIEDVRLFFSNAKAGISNNTIDSGIDDDFDEEMENEKNE